MSDTGHQTTGLDIRFLAHEISTGKRRRVAFETDRAGYRLRLRHQPNDFGDLQYMLCSA
jgi:hypothetical protein